MIPNTWLIGVDINITDDKNFDYQDQVMLLTNATPELVAAATPGSATLDLGFDAPVAGTVADKRRRGHRLHQRAAQHGRHAVQADAAST